MLSPGVTPVHVVTSAQPRLTTRFLVSLVGTSTMRARTTASSAASTTCVRSPTLNRSSAQSLHLAKAQRVTKLTLVPLAAIQSMVPVLRVLAQSTTDGQSLWLMP